jgi:hypothetical protein
LHPVHFNFVFAFRTMVSKRRGYFHITIAILAGDFHARPPCGPFFMV